MEWSDHTRPIALLPMAVPLREGLWCTDPDLTAKRVSQAATDSNGYCQAWLENAPGPHLSAPRESSRRGEPRRVSLATMEPGQADPGRKFLSLPLPC